MKISYNWLRDYIQTSLSPEELSKYLTNIGLEVEGITRFSPVKGGLEGIVVGEVKHCEKHSNADKLFVTKVDIGNGNEVPIVCGAPNVKTGQKVPVAKVGTTLYKGDERLTIKKAKLRGELSEGMICAEDEIGMGDSHEGIMELDPSARPGTPAKDYFNLETDTTIEIDLTPNRIDSASHYGVARDLAAALKQDDAEAPLVQPHVDSFSKDKPGEATRITIDEPDACPRYAGVNIENVKVDESPDWLKRRLQAIGLSPVNNIVDITNYVLHETGQPLHAFDQSKIKGNHIIVKFLPENTSFVTLDGVSHQLAEKDLMICNESEGMALAGIFGGLDSGVTESTTDVFIESAYFNPTYIRRSAKRHGISTDASFRFERGADPQMTVYALKRAALLMKEIAGGEIASEVNDVYPNPVTPATVKFNYTHAKKVIGQSIPKNTVKSILSSLEIEIEQENDDHLELKIPPYRVDVTREADVIEEILRIYGYDQVEPPHKLNATLSFQQKPDEDRIKHIVSQVLVSNGFYEIMVNSLTRAAYYSDLNSFPEENTVNIFNPLSSDLNALRQTLLFGGLETISYNINRKQEDLKLFEFGNTYRLKNNQENQENPLANYEELPHLGLFLTGRHVKKTWITNEEPTGFFHIKTYTELILKRLGLFDSTTNIQEVDSDVFAEGIQYKANKKVIARIGRVNQSLLRKFNISQHVYYADINWFLIPQMVKNHQVTYTELPKYPEVRRDLALLLDKQVNYKQIEDLAYKTEKKLLRAVSLFDVYEGDQIEKGKKSYAVSFVFRADDKTLTDKEVDNIMERFIKTFEKKLNAQIR